MAMSKQMINSQATHDSTTFATTYQGLSESELKSLHQLLLGGSSMSPYPTQEIEALKRMFQHLETFQSRLKENLVIYEKQAIEAAIVELKNVIAIKTRDVKRRLREEWNY